MLGEISFTPSFQVAKFLTVHGTCHRGISWQVMTIVTVFFYNFNLASLI